MSIDGRSRADDAAAGLIHLQGIGRCRAVRAVELSVGARTVWNYGYVYRVEAITPHPSGKTLLTTMVDERTGRRYERRLAVGRLVAVC